MVFCRNYPVELAYKQYGFKWKKIIVDIQVVDLLVLQM